MGRRKETGKCSKLTSAVLGTLSQKISILISPRVVWRVTAIFCLNSRHGSFSCWAFGDNKSVVKIKRPRTEAAAGKRLF